MTEPPIFYRLLPALYRNRDAASDHALLALTRVLEDARATIEQDIGGLYANWFAETADDWVLPYIGDLVGLSDRERSAVRLRAMVADTIAFRRRKGSLPATERRLADLTGWPVAINDSGMARRVAVRVWQQPVFTVARGTPAIAEHTQGCGWHFHPFGIDMPLFNPPRPYPGIEAPFVDALDAPYRLPAAMPGALLPLTIHADLVGDGIVRPVPPAALVSGDLSEWARADVCGDGGDSAIIVDCRRGRLLLPSRTPQRLRLAVDYTYAATSAIGGGPYERAMTVPAAAMWVATVHSAATGAAVAGQPLVFATLKAALAAYAAVPGCGLIRILDSATHDIDGVCIGTEPEGCAADPNAPRRLTIEALSGEIPCLTGSINAAGAGAGLELILSGAWIAGTITVSGQALLELRHCSLRPPRNNACAGVAIVACNSAAGSPRIVLDACFSGPVDLAPGTHMAAGTSVIAGGDGGAAIAGDGIVVLAAVTVLGTAVMARLDAVDVIFADRIAVADCDQGGIRTSYIPHGSRAPHRTHCVTGAPDTAPDTGPHFVTRHFGQPGYAALAPATHASITKGGTAGREMGTYNSLATAEREALLEAGLQACLPVGMGWTVELV